MLAKKEQNKWSRLTKDNKKYSNITVDWSNWVDSDEEVEEEDMYGGAGKGFDFGGAGGMGMGGGDSDDEDAGAPGLDDLEGEEKVEDHTKANAEKLEEEK